MPKVRFCEKHPDISCQYSWAEGVVTDEKSITLSCRDNDPCENMIDSNYSLEKNIGQKVKGLA